MASLWRDYIPMIDELPEETVVALESAWEEMLQYQQDQEALIIELKDRKIQEIKTELRKCVEQSKFTREMGRKIASALDTDTVIRRYMSVLKGFVPCDRLLLALSQKSLDSFSYHIYGFHSEERTIMKIINDGSVHKSIVGCLQSEKARIVNGIVPEYGCGLASEGGNTLAIPLIIQGRPLGAVVLHSRPEEPFKDVHVDFLSPLSVFLSVGLSNARSHKEIADLNRELQEEKHALMAASARVTRMANYDSLTNLPNLRLLNEFIPRYMNQTRRQKWVMALFFIDLDDFKPINDVHGHAAGDSLLIEVGKRLRQSLRQSDVVARIGGDEFIALAQGLQGDKDAENIVLKVLDSLKKPIMVNGVDVHVGASVGITLYKGGDETADELKQQADSAMYSIKNSGKYNYSFYDANTSSVEAARS